MEWQSLIFRTVIVYLLVFLVLRIMGKREIGKLSIFDLVISIMIAEIAVLIVESPDKPLLEGFLPMGLLLGIQIGMAYISLKSQKIREWFDGKPSVLIRNGKIDRKELKKTRYNLDDLLLQLRQHKVTNIADIQYALLETNGNLSVLEKAEQSKQHAGYEGFPLPLIMDGRLQTKNLHKLERTEAWLKSELKARGIDRYKDVFFCCLDNNGKLYISE